jgi:REP element-mobilizing transposase RayT
MYHIYARGNNRENIFIKPENYRYFLDLYVRHVVPIADTFAYCLLRNHFHMLLRIKTEEEVDTTLTETPSVSGKRLGSRRHPTPSQTVANFLNAYAKAINIAYGRTGSLFQHPFGRIPVTSERYLLNLVQYIHFNPQKHGFVADFREYPYSSFPIFSSNNETRLKRAEVIEWFNGREQFQEFHSARQDEKLILALIGDDPD